MEHRHPAGSFLDLAFDPSAILIYYRQDAGVPFVSGVTFYLHPGSPCKIKVDQKYGLFHSLLLIKEICA